MKKKIFISIVFIILLPVFIYLIISGILTVRGPLVTAVLVIIIALASMWIRIKMIKGEIKSVEIKSIDENGKLINSSILIEQPDMEKICTIFNKNAKLFYKEGFEYCGYAIYINSNKTTIIYPDKVDKSQMKINSSIWGLEITEQEEKELDHLLKKYKIK